MHYISCGTKQLHGFCQSTGLKTMRLTVQDLPGIPVRESPFTGFFQPETIANREWCQCYARQPRNIDNICVYIIYNVYISISKYLYIYIYVYSV